MSSKLDHGPDLAADVVAGQKVDRRSDARERERASYNLDIDLVQRLNNKLDSMGLNRSAFIEYQMHDFVEASDLRETLIRKAELVAAFRTMLDMYHLTYCQVSDVTAYLKNMAQVSLGYGILAASSRAHAPRDVGQSLEAFFRETQRRHHQRISHVLGRTLRLLLDWREKFENLRGGTLDLAEPIAEVIEHIDRACDYTRQEQADIESYLSQQPYHDGHTFEQFMMDHFSRIYGLPGLQGEQAPA